MFTYSLSGLEITASADVPAEVEESETTARSAVYQVLASFFGPVDTEHYDRASRGGWAEEIEKAATLLPYAIDTGPEGLSTEMTLEEYAAERARVFSDPSEEDHLLREATYASEPDAVIPQVTREYDYFGLSTSTSGSRPPDHLVTECDFMQYLCFREAATSSDRLRASYRRAQREFLDRHLGTWASLVAVSVSQRSPKDPFMTGVERLASFVRADLAYVTNLLAA